jgi:malate/lactate dehydrogenase
MFGVPPPNLNRQPQPPPTANRQVVEAKAGAGSATLSMAYAAARMAESTLLGLSGEPSVFECAFVQSEVRGFLR